MDKVYIKIPESVYMKLNDMLWNNIIQIYGKNKPTIISIQ